MPQHLIEQTSRSSEFNILENILHRWSPRSFNGAPVDEETVSKLFEAAKWAPSSRNEQPWRFLYAFSQDSFWNEYLELLADGNIPWCKNAGVLIVVISKKTFFHNGLPNNTHSLDTGMAVQNLLLEAASTPGLAAHPMAGFDRPKTRRLLEIPEEFEVECMIAVGHQAPAELLPDDLKAREIPSSRKPLQEITAQGKFSF